MEFNLVLKKEQHCIQNSLSNSYKITSCALLTYFGYLNVSQCLSGALGFSIPLLFIVEKDTYK